MTIRPPIQARRVLASPSQCLFIRRPQQVRTFLASTRLLQDKPVPTHYEILKVPTTVTKAELKRQFYNLSKETHPDINPHTPDASTRFAQISESYSILADPEKRKKYDREVLRPREQRQQARGGTYAGHRPATGLSKRRGTFRGPPPSFYSHGNPSANTARQAHVKHDDKGYNKGGVFNASSYAEPGQWDPDFNSNSTYKTQSHEDTRRQSRRQAAMAAAQAQSEDESAFWARFVIVSAIVFIGVSMGTLVVSMSNTKKGGLTRADGSRRDGPRNEWAKG